MQYFVSHLNSKNVKRLDTNETVVSSNDGTTTITGPILIQKDGDGVTRLMQGYDSATDTFIYALFNASGTQTVGINSTGNATFTGDIIGSTIQTAADGNARIELTSSGLASYNASDELQGISILLGTFGFSEIQFYNENSLLVGGLGYDSIGAVTLYSDSGATLYLAGKISFLNADSIAGLITDTEAAHSHTGYTGYADGTVGSHRHVVSSDGSHSHDIEIG